MGNEGRRGKKPPIRLNRLSLCCAAAALMAAGGAAAQDRPPPLKLSQDVAVTYRYVMDGEALAAAAGIDPDSMVGQAMRDMADIQTRTLRQASTGRIRSENAGLVQIVDPRSRRSWQFDTSPDAPGGRVVFVSEGEDEVGMQIEEVAQDPEFLMRREAGVDTVAGQDCTNWRIQPHDDDSVVWAACFAADGLALRIRLESEGMTSVQEATQIDYGPLDPALFSPPADWPVQPAIE